MSNRPWYAQTPQEGTGVAARAFLAAPAMHTSTVHMTTMHTSTMHTSTVPTRSLIDDHKIGRPRVPGGSTG